MGHVRYSGHLDAPQDAAWDLATRPRRFPEWDPLFCGVIDDDQRLDRPGVAFRAVLRVAGRQLDGRVEVVAAECPRLLVLAGVAGNDLRLTWTWRFARLGRGVEVSVELDYVLADELAGDSADLLFVERSVGRSLRSAVENFTDLVQVRQLSTIPG